MRPFWRTARARRDAAWDKVVHPSTRALDLAALADHLADLLATSQQRARFAGREFPVILDQPDPYAEDMAAGGPAPTAALRIFTSRAAVGDPLPRPHDTIELSDPDGTWRSYVITAMPEMFEHDDPGLTLDLEPEEPDQP